MNKQYPDGADGSGNTDTTTPTVPSQPQVQSGFTPNLNIHYAAAPADKGNAGGPAETTQAGLVKAMLVAMEMVTEMAMAMHTEKYAIYC